MSTDDAGPAHLDRSRLPLRVDTAARPIRPVQPPPGSPNVVIVLIDDMGFGASAAYGGPCEMPTAQRLADEGLRYSRFHVTPLCSPTRQALMTGRNHHSVGMGVTSEMSTLSPATTATDRTAPPPSHRSSAATATARRRSASGTRRRRWR